MSVGTRTITRNKGESIVLQFSYNTIDGVQDLVGVYTVAHIMNLGDEVVAFGSVSIVAGVDPVPDKVKFELTDSESAALDEIGNYHGVVTLTNIVDTDETVDLLDLNVQIIDSSITFTIPISRQEVSGILELGDDYSVQKLDRAIRLAESRIKAWLPKEVFKHSLENGWSARLITECENCASIILRMRIYENDEEAKADLKDCQDIISNFSIDTDNDGELDTGGVRTVPILREAADELTNERTRRYSDRFDNS